MGTLRYPAVFLLGWGVFLSVASSVRASAGADSADFLRIPVGAEAASLGSAYSALAENAYATTANPAGLGFLDSTQLAGQHLVYLESIHYEYLGFAHPTHKGEGLGASIQYLGSGDISGTDATGTPTGDFSTSFSAYSLSYGRTLNSKLSLGLAAKWVHAALSDVTANAFALDLGSLYHVRNNLTLAAVLTNVGTKLTFLNDSNSLPLTFKAGLAYRPARQWTTLLEGWYEKTGEKSAHLGLEYRPLPLLQLRMGYRTDTLKELSPLAGLTAGMGLELWGQEFAYAWVPLGELGNTHYFSFLMHFGQGDRERRNLIRYNPLRSHRKAQGNGEENQDSEQLMLLLEEKDKTHVTESTNNADPNASKP